MLAAVKEWAKNQTYIIAILSPQIITTVRDFHIDFQHIKSRRFGNHQFAPQHLRAWFTLYRSHRKGIKFLKALYSALLGPDFVSDVSEFMRELRKIKCIDKNTLLENQPTQEEFAEILNILNDLHEASLEDIENDFTNKPPDADTEDAVKKLLADNPLDSSFFLFVTVPCWLLYRMSPTHLYSKARHNDFDALERLLRLDPLTLHDPYIGMKIVEYRFNRQSAKYRKLLAAPHKPPKGGLDQKNVMISAIGLINALSHLTTKPLIVSDIFNLVAAIDQDCGTNLLEALPKEPDALARALQPDRNLWRQLLNPDKKK